MSIPLITLLVVWPALIAVDHPVDSPPEAQELTLLFTGDIMQHMPQVEAAWNDSLGIYIYDSCFRYVSDIFHSYDLVVANLETTLAGRPYSGYPAFSSPDELAVGMLMAGIDIVGTANNHCCDRGYSGLVRTVSLLDSLGLKRMGTYRDNDDFRNQNPLIIRKNGISVAFLNYTYGTNGISVPTGTVVSLIEKERIQLDLQAARDSQPDKIIVYIHWGDEYMREPNDYQKDIAGFCFNEGADIIIGSHPHVLQRMEWHKPDSLAKEKLVAWSLGNFVSNQRKRYTDGGAMVGITLRKQNQSTAIAEAGYHLTWVYNPVERGKRQYYILPVSNVEGDTLFPDRDSRTMMQTFIDDSRELLKSNINFPERK